MAKAMHGEPDAGKLARPVRRGGWRNLPWRQGKALHPYSTDHLRGRFALRFAHRRQNPRLGHLAEIALNSRRPMRAHIEPDLFGQSIGVIQRL